AAVFPLVDVDLDPPSAALDADRREVQSRQLGRDRGAAGRPARYGVGLGGAASGAALRLVGGDRCIRDLDVSGVPTDYLSFGTEIRRQAELRRPRRQSRHGLQAASQATPRQRTI